MSLVVIAENLFDEHQIEHPFEVRHYESDVAGGQSIGQIAGDNVPRSSAR